MVKGTSFYGGGIFLVHGKEWKNHKYIRKEVINGKPDIIMEMEMHMIKMVLII